MSQVRIPITKTYDAEILDAAWDLREKFAIPWEAGVGELDGIYLNQWNSGNELSPGCYRIVERNKKGQALVEKPVALDTWVSGLSTFSEIPKVRKNPSQIVEALIDICLAQDKSRDIENG